MRIYIFIIEVLLIAIAIFRIAQMDEAPSKSEAVEIAGQNQARKVEQTQPQRLDSAASCQPQPSAKVPVRNYLDSIPADEVAERESFQSPALAISKAKRGDAVAAIALFQMVASCYPIGTKQDSSGKFIARRNCPEVPGELVSDRFSLLEPLAEAGDVRVQTVYLLNALPIADVLARGATNEAVVEAKRLRAAAERFGKAAAEAGGREASIMISRAYLNGAFGVRDPSQAYIHLMRVKEVDPSPQINEQLANLARQLSARAQQLAKAKLSVCAPSVAPGALANPFD